MKTIHQLYQINAPITIVWQALIDPKAIDNWGGGPAKMSEKKGSSFTLWGKDIWGRNIEVIKKEKLVQEWHDDKDNDGMIVTMTLEKDGENTTLTLLHENVPDKKYDSLSEGWEDYYLGPLKKFVERQTTE